MANAYTTRLQLNQWASGDKFLREEFNRDNQRIEDACVELYDRSDTLDTKIDTETGTLRQQLLDKTGTLETRLSTETADIRRQLDPASYHIYQLMLQNYYDGKYTAYKKAMIFDGFQDASLVAAVTPGAYLDTAQKQVRILTQGAQNIDTGFIQEAGWTGSMDSDGGSCAWIGQSGGTYSKDTTLQPSGFGVLQSVTLRLAVRNTGTPITVTITLLDGTKQLAVSQSATVNSTTFRDYTFAFTGGVSLDGLKNYILRITNVNQGYYLKAMYIASRDKVAYKAVFTPTNHTNGSIRTPAIQMGKSYTRVAAWARYSGGLGITLNAGSTSRILTVGSSRSAQTMDGTACTETSYTLEDAPVSSDGNVTLALSLSVSGGSGILYDYGIVFI